VLRTYHNLVFHIICSAVAPGVRLCSSYWPQEGSFASKCVEGVDAASALGYLLLRVAPPPFSSSSVFQGIHAWFWTDFCSGSHTYTLTKRK